MKTFKLSFLQELMLLENRIIWRDSCIPSSLFQANRVFSHKIGADTLQVWHELEYYVQISICLRLLIQIFFFVAFLYAHKHDCYTGFNTFQPHILHFLSHPWLGNAKTRTNRLLTFLMLITLSPAHFGTTT